MLASVTAALAGSVSVSVVAGLLPSEAAASVSTGVSVVTGVSVRGSWFGQLRLQMAPLLTLPERLG